MEVLNLFNSLNSMEDLEKLVSNEIRESEVLEYKGVRRKFTDGDKNEIAKDVSAIANSNGGVIIYGIETDTNDKTKPVSVTGITDDANIETFDRVVNSQIRKEIKGIQKKIIEKNDIKVMIIFVPQSDDMPHQSLVDKRYYRRSLTESIPMEYDIIELHFGKRLGPILNLEVENIEKKNIERFTFMEDGFSEPLKLRLIISNSGHRVGKYVEAIFFFPDATKVRIDRSENLQNIDYLYVERKQQARQFTKQSGVIHPFLDMRIADLTIQVAREWFEKESFVEPLIVWTTYADEMNPRTDKVFLRGPKITCELK